MSFDSSADPADRIIALTSVQAKQLLIGCMYTFHIQRSGRTSLCIVFLSNKAEATYRRLMVVISDLTNKRFPTDILFDFERGAIKVIQANFADANVKGCFFHLCSNVWKH